MGVSMPALCLPRVFTTKTTLKSSPKQSAVSALLARYAEIQDINRELSSKTC